MAVRALTGGAFDFLTKPFAADHLVSSSRRALAHRALILDNRRLVAAAQEIDSPLIGESPAMVRLRETIAQLAPADIDVLIEGETIGRAQCRESVCENVYIWGGAGSVKKK